MAQRGGGRARSATVRATNGERPKRPRVDSGVEFENILRQMFVFRVHRWCKDALESKILESMPTNDERGEIVDNLTAQWSSAVESTIDAAVDSYLSTVVEDDVDEVDCPKCDKVMELPEDYVEGTEVGCPHCGEMFVPDDGPDEDPSGEGEPIDAEFVEASPRAARGRR